MSEPTNSTATFDNDGLRRMWWTFFDSKSYAHGLIWTRYRGWGTWEDRGDRVMRCRKTDEVPAWAEAALERERELIPS